MTQTIECAHDYNWQGVCVRGCGVPEFKPVENHPECKRWTLGISGPVDRQHRIIITKHSGQWSWRYKRAGDRQYVYIDTVARLPVSRLFQEIRLIELVADLY